MKTIVCRICGSEIDASAGICPRCGTVFYVEEAPATGSSTKAQSTHSTDEIRNADNDELFNTRVWKNADNDDTRVYGAQGQPRQGSAPQPRYEAQPVNDEEESAKPAYKKIFIVAGVFLAAVAVLLIAIMSGAFDFNKGGSGSQMPNLVGSTQESAASIMENMGLVVKINTRESDGAAGLVLEQSINPGSNVISGQGVTLTVSRAKQGAEAQAGDVTVIGVVGTRYENAYSQLTSIGLRVTRAEDAYDEDVPEGYVISQSPLRGAVLKEGDIVTLTVSKGEEPVVEFVIMVSASTGGSVSPNGEVTVEEGKSQTFNITPAAGYEISEIKVDGADILPNPTVTIGNVTSDRTLYVTFRPVAPETPPPPTETEPTTEPPIETPLEPPA